jgi:putative oxidoreductase
MTAAVLTVHARNGLWVTQNGFEYNLVLVAAVFALAAVGAGAVSLDSALGLDVAGTGWALGALGAGLLGGLGAVLSRRFVGSRSPVDAEHASTT